MENRAKKETDSARDDKEQAALEAGFVVIVMIAAAGMGSVIPMRMGMVVMVMAVVVVAIAMLARLLNLRGRCR